jgi:hypothetical protein
MNFIKNLLISVFNFLYEWNKWFYNIFILPACVDFRKKVLVFDMNNVIMDREHMGRSEVVKSKYEHKKEGDVWTDMYGNKTVKVGDNIVHIRPLFGKFFKEVCSEYTVIVWSSMRRENIETILGAMLEVEGVMGSRAPLVFDIFDQSHCMKLDTTETQGKPVFAKNLNKIWDKYEFCNELNTILVDDNEKKALYKSDRCHLHPVRWTKDKPESTCMDLYREIKAFLEKQKSV